MTASFNTFSTHYFESSGEAYDATQTGYYRTIGGLEGLIEIHDGALLVVPSEGIYGFLYQAWPIAVSATTGEFHRTTNEWWTPENIDRYREVWTAAWSLDQMSLDEALWQESGLLDRGPDVNIEDEYDGWDEADAVNEAWRV